MEQVRVEHAEDIEEQSRTDGMYSKKGKFPRYKTQKDCCLRVTGRYFKVIALKAWLIALS